MGRAGCLLTNFVKAHATQDHALNLTAICQLSGCVFFCGHVGCSYVNSLCKGSSDNLSSCKEFIVADTLVVAGTVAKVPAQPHKRTSQQS